MEISLNFTRVSVYKSTNVVKYGIYRLVCCPIIFIISLNDLLINYQVMTCNV